MTEEQSKLLKETFETQPNRTDVWLNEKGEWLFNEKEGFDTHLTRDEVLSETSVDVEATIAETTEKKSKKN